MSPLSDHKKYNTHISYPVLFAIRIFKNHKKLFQIKVLIWIQGSICPHFINFVTPFASPWCQDLNFQDWGEFQFLKFSHFKHNCFWLNWRQGRNVCKFRRAKIAQGKITLYYIVTWLRFNSYLEWGWDKDRDLSNWFHFWGRLLQQNLWSLFHAVLRLLTLSTEAAPQGILGNGSISKPRANQRLCHHARRI